MSYVISVYNTIYIELMPKAWSAISFRALKPIIVIKFKPHCLFVNYLINQIIIEVTFKQFF